MKGGLEGLSPLLTGLAPDPQRHGRPEGPHLWSPWPGPLGAGAGLLGGGLAGLSFVFRKRSPLPVLGWQGPRPWWGVWGGAPSAEPGPPPPGWGTNPALIARTPPAHMCAQGGGEKAPETAGKEEWTRWGGPCPAGRKGVGGEGLKTTRINRFVYHEQARVFTS
jgi:hypothetical protein